MNMNEALTVCFGLVLAAFVLLAPVACTVNRHNQIAEVIKAGVNPTEAKCAIEADTGNTTVCIIISMKGVPK